MKTITGKIKVLVVDDEPVVRDGLTKILGSEPYFAVVGTTGGSDAIERAVKTQPDIMLLDIFMPNISGLELMPEIKEKLPDTKVVLLTVSDDEDDLLSALRLGAQGYLLKSSNVDVIVDGVRRIAAGEIVLSSKMLYKLAADIQHGGKKDRLSIRESSVLELVREGMTNVDIARQLKIQESTVKSHVHSLLRKLHFKNRREIAFFPRRSFR